MQGVNAVFKLVEYNVTEFSYSINNEFSSQEETLQIPFKFSNKITGLDENNFSIDIKAKIEDAKNFPFKLNCAIRAIFNVEKWEENKEQNEMTALTILFPYMRTLVTTLTSAAEVQPIMLPVMNIVELVKSQRKAKKETK
ncbi:MAG: hypothetical protein E7340_01885 [Clostridiales bacterium]|nr:hypothetical protein [Clostridiales bacterium]